VAAVLAVPRLSAAQAVAPSAAPPDLPRIYVDVNALGYSSPLGESKTFQKYGLNFGEVATFKATYPEPSGSGPFPAYLGGGYMVSRLLAVGVSYSRMSRDSAVDVSAEIPHPAFFNAIAAGSGTTGTTLSRRESAVHVSLALVPVRSNRLEFRLLGGPSFFTLKGDMVSEIEYEQTFDSLAPQSTVTVSGMSTRAASGNAIGFHAGADLTYFVHRFVGVAGGVRYGRATVAVDTEPLSAIRQEFLVGSTTAFLGLRVRIVRLNWNE
jgi:hypothetical protein